jgi:hypothetical protein
MRFHRTCLISLFMVLFYSCQKSDSETPDIPKNVNKEALFTTNVQCGTFEYEFADTLHYIDSTFIFKNLSDTSNLSFLWSFGDGSTSTLDNPTHIYTSPGYYNVTLTSLFNNLPVDTSSLNIRALLGEAEFKSTIHETTDAIDIEETDDKDILMILFETSGGNNRKYSLVKTDSLFKIKWWRSYPLETNRFFSISKNNDGTFILSGNIIPGNPTIFSISKIDKNGNPIWAKSFSGTIGWNNYTKQTNAGGFITVGETTRLSPVGNTIAYSVVIKTDDAGNEMWRYSFDRGGNLSEPKYTKNLVELNNKFYIPAVSSSGFGTDTIFVATIDNQGYELQRTNLSIIPANQWNIGPVGIETVNGRFMIYGHGNCRVFLSDSSLSQIQTKEMFPCDGIMNVLGKDGKFYTAEGSNQYYSMKAYTTEGQKVWEKVLGSWVRIGCRGYAALLSRQSVKIKYSSTNHLMLLTHGTNNTMSNSSKRSSYIRKLTMNGGYY